MVDIQYTAAEIRRGKRRKIEITAQKYSYSCSKKLSASSSPTLYDQGLCPWTLLAAQLPCPPAYSCQCLPFPPNVGCLDETLITTFCSQLVTKQRKTVPAQAKGLKKIQITQHYHTLYNFRRGKGYFILWCGHCNVVARTDHPSFLSICQVQVY